MAAGLDFLDYIDERTRDFTGREWFFDEIERWLGSPDAPQFFILTGDPGIGKSAIAARLTQFSEGALSPYKQYKHTKKGFINAYHFCSARHGGWIAPETFARSLSAHLAVKYPKFAEAVATSLKFEVKLTIGSNFGTAVALMINEYHAENSEAIFNNLIRQPLNALCDQQSFSDPLLILVDGLDEALYYSGRTNIASLLASCHDISPKVRFLITSRNKDEVLRLFRPLKPYILYAKKEENMKDLRIYLRNRFVVSERLRFLAGGDEKVEEVIESLSRRSSGNFLVVSKLIDSIEIHEISIDKLGSLPTELKDLYTWFLDRLTKGDENRWRVLYRPVLGTMIAAFEPLDISTISMWSGLSREKVNDAVLDLKEFLDPVIERKNRLYHESVVDFLTGDDSGVFFIDRSEYHRRIAKSFEEFLEGDEEWSRCELYGIKYLPSHLTAAGEWKNLARLLTDFGFMEAKSRSFSVYDLEADYRNSLKAWEGDNEGKSLLKAFEDCLNLQAHHINQSPALLFPLLYNHMVWLDAPIKISEKGGPIYRNCKKGEAEHSNWLRMVQDPRPTPPLWVNSFEGHTNYVKSVAITSDGHVVSGSSDQTIKVWEIATGKLLRSMEGHRGSVNSVAVTSDGHVVSGSSDRTIKVWDLATGKLLRSMEGHKGPVTSVAVASNRQIMSGSGDRTIKVWEIATGKLLRSMEGHKGPVTSVAVASNRQIVSGSGDRTIKVWDLDTGKPLRSMVGHTKWVNSIALTSDGHVVSGSSDWTIKVWEMATGKSLRSIAGHEGWINSVAIISDREIVSGSSDRTITFWDLDTGKPLRSMVGHTKWVNSIAVISNSHVVSGSRDGTIKIWELTSGRLLRSLEGHTGSVSSVAVTSDGLVVSGSYDREIKVWEMATGKLLRSMKGHLGSVNSVAVTSDGLVVSGSDEGTIEIWELTSGRLLRSLEGHTGPVNSVAVTSDGLVVSGSDEGTIEIWELTSGRLLKSLEGHTGPVNSVAVTYDGHYIVSGSRDRTIKIWETATGRFLESIEGHTASVNSVALTSDGYVISGCRDKTVKVWKIVAGRLQRSIESHRGRVNSVAVAPNGHVASASDDWIVKIWDTGTGRLLKSMEGHTGPVTSITVAICGQVVSGSRDKTVKVWDLDTGKLLRSMKGHSGSVNSVAVTFDGHYIVSGSRDGAINVWELTSGRLLRSLEGHTDSVNSVAVTSDSHVVSGCSDGIIKVWETKSCKSFDIFRADSDILCIALSQDSRWLAYGDNCARVWIFEWIDNFCPKNCTEISNSQ